MGEYNIFEINYLFKVIKYSRLIGKCAMKAICHRLVCDAMNEVRYRKIEKK